MQAHQYKNRILLAVTGLTPQTVTETLYGLAVEQKPAFVPTEIHIITTREGAQRIKLLLLEKEQGEYHKLINDYGLLDKGIKFDNSTIHIIKDDNGRALDDIRTENHNTLVADTLVNLVRELTKDKSSAIHASIAGGRKTMGINLGLAMSLFGRRQDRMSHVLVSAPFESNPEFFYPPAKPKVILTREGRPVKTDTASITLGDIPFVRLRYGLGDNIIKGNTSYRDTVKIAQQEMEPPTLLINLHDKTITAGTHCISLPPAELAFLSWLADRAEKIESPVNCPSEGAPEQQHAEGFLNHYQTILGTAGDDDRTREALGKGMDKNYFERRKTNLHKHLKKQLGPLAATPYLVHRLKTKNGNKYGLKLSPEQISRYVHPITPWYGTPAAMATLWETLDTEEPSEGKT